MQAPPRNQRSIRELRMAERATQGPLSTDFANSTKAMGQQVAAMRGGLALRKEPSQAIDWEALSDQAKRVAQVMRENSQRTGLGHQQEKYRQLTEARGTAHAEMRRNSPSALQRHARGLPSETAGGSAFATTKPGGRKIACASKCPYWAGRRFGVCPSR